jgi:hypothetical protein
VPTLPASLPMKASTSSLLGKLFLCGCDIKHSSEKTGVRARLPAALR